MESHLEETTRRQGIQRRPSHPQPGRWVQAQGQGGGTHQGGRKKSQAEPYLSLSETDIKYNKNFFKKKSTCWQGNISEVSQSEKGLQSYLYGLVLTLLSEYTFIDAYIN